MIFQHTIDKVLSGEKTQTSRLVKPNHVGSFAGGTYLGVFGVDGRPPIYHVGYDYAAQPGRGKKAVARIQILTINKRDVREFSDDEIEAEGFQSQHDFWHTWVKMHDKHYLDKYCYAADVDYLHEYGFYARPAERYQAWVLTFELVKTLEQTS